MALLLGQWVDYISGSGWRYVPAFSLLFAFAFCSARDTRAIVIGVPPAMIRTKAAAELARDFTRDTGVRTSIVPLSAAALSDFRRHAVDVAFAHDPRVVKALRTNGRWTRPLIAADFAIVGPASDPASVSEARSVREAFRRIWSSGAPFRPAPDGTAAALLEEDLWKQAGLPGPSSRPSDRVASAITAAADAGAYMVVDRLSFDSLYSGSKLVPLYSGDEMLTDRYAVTGLSSSSEARRTGRVFRRWLGSDRGRVALRRAFGVDLAAFPQSRTAGS